jgi:signal transduction histidine kinase
MNPPRRLLSCARQMSWFMALDSRRRTFAIAAAAVALISVLYALNIRTVFFGLWQLALPWMTLLLASAGDLYSALTGHENEFQTALTGILAVLLTVNMILERKEFLEMLTDIETTRSTLNREFKTALVGIRQMSDQVKVADHAYDEDVRVLAADIHGQADRLDHMLERML